MIRFALWRHDRTLREYEGLPASVVGEETMTARTNAVAKWATEKGKYIGWVADDNRFRSVGWDREVLSALQDVPIVFGNDEVSPGSKPSHVFMDARIVKTLGWIVHPDLRSTFFDDVWANLGAGPIDVSRPLFERDALPSWSRLRQAVSRSDNGLGLVYLPNVEIPHLYTERDNSANFLADMETYQHWLRHDCEDDIRRVQKALRSHAR